jgi:hypothetical protein
MDWIKRNLFFVIGSVVALVLMGLAGWFVYSKWDLNNQILANLNNDYEELRRLNSQNPHPGNDKIDNIRAARDQEKALRDFLKKAYAHCQRISPIPDLPKISDQDFSTAMSRTIDQMQKEATNNNVTVAPGYNFSFDAQKNKVSFAAGSLAPLSLQLGELKVICEVLFQAKINSLDAIRRERVSADDNTGPQTAYLSDKTVTNEMAVLTPYELTFKCFSSELASALSGFANSPYGLVVKTINVKAAPPTSMETPMGAPFISQPGPTYIPQPTMRAGEGGDAGAAFRSRYGIGGPGGMGGRYGGGGGANLGGIQYRPLEPGQPVYAAPAPAQFTPSPAAGRGGLTTVLDEKQLEVVITLVVVKLVPAKGA